MIERVTIVAALVSSSFLLQRSSRKEVIPVCKSLRKAQLLCKAAGTATPAGRYSISTRADGTAALRSARDALRGSYRYTHINY